MSEARSLAGIPLTNPIRQLFMAGIVWRLAQDLKNKKLELLEVGSWNGGSTLTWGEALNRYSPHGGRITCIDAWEPHFDTTANVRQIYQTINTALADGSAYAHFQTNMSLMPDNVDIDVRRGRSQDILPTLPQTRYDLVYLDGDHTYTAVRQDIENARSLVAEDGILCGDDLEVQACEVGAKLALADENIDLGYLPTLQKRFHPGVTMAVDEIFGPVSVWEGFWAMRKRSDGWEPVDLAGMPFAILSFLSEDQLIQVHKYLTAMRGGG